MIRTSLAAVAFVALAASALAQAPAENGGEEHLLWCSSLYFFLASDALDAGEDADAQLYEEQGSALLDRASDRLDETAPTATELADTVLDMDNRVLEEFSADALSYAPETCETLLMPQP